MCMHTIFLKQYYSLNWGSFSSPRQLFIDAPPITPSPPPLCGGWARPKIGSNSYFGPLLPLQHGDTRFTTMTTLRKEK